MYSSVYTSFSNIVIVHIFTLMMVNIPCSFLYWWDCSNTRVEKYSSLRNYCCSRIVAESIWILFSRFSLLGPRLGYNAGCEFWSQENVWMILIDSVLMPIKVLMWINPVFECGKYDIWMLLLLSLISDRQFAIDYIKYELWNEIKMELIKKMVIS